MEKVRYKAFLSYSHRDQAWAAWLQKALESYRVPRRLVGTEGHFGPIPRRLAPVFRDREDLSSASDLSAKVKEALEASESLVVVCSPAAAQSAWVSEEVRYFRQLGREERVFALIVNGDPQSRDAQSRCFPDVLTTSEDGSTREPLAADARKWADGKLLAKLKLVAGILGIPLDALRRREQQRRQRIWMASMAGTLTIALVMTVLAITAITARKAAENRREHAENLVGYMVGDLKTKLDEAGRLDILEGMGGRVSEYLESLDPDEVTDESLNQQAQVWRQLGEVSMDQGELSEALRAFTTSRDILAEMFRRKPDEPQYIYELGNAEFWIGYVHLERGDFDLAEEAMQHYLDFADKLVIADPENPEWVMEKSYAHNNLAALMISRGGADINRALPEIRAALVLVKRVMELDPDEPAYRGEYGESLAWLADIQLLACNLGDALKSRQENVAVASELLELDPANTNRRSRYAYSLSGLAHVEEQVGMAELAATHFTEARSLLGQLVVSDPTNVVLRHDYLRLEGDVARLMAEAGRVADALRRFETLREPMLRLLEEESWENLYRHKHWVRLMLDWSEALWVSGDDAGAEALLLEALKRLQQLIEKESGLESYKGVLLQARFLNWQQTGKDLLDLPAFSVLEVSFEERNISCQAQADLVRQAILAGEETIAADLAAALLGRGYYEPGFIRVCRSYGVCKDRS